MSLQHIQLRPKEQKEKKPDALQKALKKGTTYGGEIKPYAGPTPTREKYKGATNLSKPYFRPGAGSLEEALRAATPATGSAPDVQGEAWARRDEIVAANQAKLDAEADALYQAAQGLSKPDQDYILSKVVGKDQGSSSLITALGGAPGTEDVTARAERYEREGKQWTPEEQALHYAELNEQDPSWDKTAPYARKATSIGVTDPLMKTLIDKNYIKKTATGWGWMMPEKEKEIVSTYQWTDENGWLNQTTTLSDNTTTTETLGRAAKEPVKGMTIEQGIALQELDMKISGHSERHRNKAFELFGDPPVPGMTAITVPAGSTLPDGTIAREDTTTMATQEHLNQWMEGVELFTTYLSVNAGDAVASRELSLGDVKAAHAGDSDAIANLRQELGLTPGKEWDDELDNALSQLGYQTSSESPDGAEEVATRDWKDWALTWGVPLLGAALISSPYLVPLLAGAGKYALTAGASKLAPVAGAAGAALLKKVAPTAVKSGATLLKKNVAPMSAAAWKALLKKGGQ